MTVCDEIVIARLDKRETELWEQGATLDLKASILLVAITFLAGQTTFLLSKNPTGPHFWLQVGSLVLQFVAAILCAWLLAMIKYKVEFAERYIQWAEDRSLGYPEAIKTMEQELKGTIIDSAKERIARNMANNNRKVCLATWCYWFTLVAFLSNVIVSLRLLGLPFVNH